MNYKDLPELTFSVGQGTARLACSPAVRGPAIRRVVQMDTAACPHLAGCLRVVCALPRAQEQEQQRTA